MTININARNSSKDVSELKRSVLDTIKEVSSDPERLKKFSKFIINFHEYTLFNKMLIFIQNNEATQVAGYRSWESRFNRHVKKGEKGLKILAPILKSEARVVNGVVVMENGRIVKDKVLIGFKSVTVFDVSQTEGDEIEIPAAKGILTDDPEFAYKEMVMMLALDKYNVTEGDVKFDKLFRIDDKYNITISSGIPIDSKLLSLVEAITYDVLDHFKRTGVPSKEKNQEIEITTSIVGCSLGVPINTWDDPNLLTEVTDKTITRCFKAADKIVNLFGREMPVKTAN